LRIHIDEDLFGGGPGWRMICNQGFELLGQ
jgi:hypothetical protein